jgi:nucleoside-triphosphatase THEP1
LNNALAHEEQGGDRHEKSLINRTPGYGKITLLEKVIERTRVPCIGFVTKEIREAGRRKGFKIMTLAREEGILAHKKIGGGLRVGKYGVNLQKLEQIAAPSIVPQNPGEVVIIDEIGKMECLSKVFRKTVLDVLDSPNLVLGTIALKGKDFIESIKARPDIELIQITQQNRSALVDKLVDRLNSREA